MTRSLCHATAIAGGAFVLCLAHSLPATAQRSLAVVPAQIDSIVMAHQAKNHIPAVSLLVSSTTGVTLYAKIYGSARVLPPMPAGTHTRFHLGSISKPYASVVVHRLAEQGRIDLGAPIGRYLPELPTWRDSVTIRQLLSHVSGIIDFTDVTGWSDTAMAAPFVGRALASPLAVPPGTRMVYSNTNFALVQRLIERVEHRPYADVVDDFVLQPLNLRETTTDCVASPPEELAHGHEPGRDDIPMPVPGPGAGHYPGAVAGTCATASDVVRFFSSLLSGRILNAASVEDMHRAVSQDGNGVASGAGLFVGAETTGEVWKHGGQIRGWNSEVAIWPRDSLILVVLTNHFYGESEQLSRLIARSIFGIVTAPPLDVPISDEALGQYAGRYLTDGGRMIVSVRDRRLHLMGQPCSYQGRDVFVCDPDQWRTVRFLPERDGVREAWLLVEGTRRIVGVRRP